MGWIFLLWWEVPGPGFSCGPVLLLPVTILSMWAGLQYTKDWEKEIIEGLRVANRFRIFIFDLGLYNIQPIFL